MDPLGNHAYNDNNYPCDGADLGLLEGDMHIDCDNSCGLDQDTEHAYVLLGIVEGYRWCS